MRHSSTMYDNTKIEERFRENTEAWKYESPLRIDCTSLLDDLYDCFNGRALTANIFESGSMPTPWKFLAGSTAIPSCWLGES